MDMEAKIVVSQKGLHKRGPVSFQLIVDGRKKGEVSRGDKEYAVDPGRHFAEVQYVLVKTNQVNFNLESGGEVHLVFSPNYWIMLVPLCMMLIFSILAAIPYNPTVMLYAGALMMVLMPILMIAIVIKPGMLMKLAIEQ